MKQHDVVQVSGDVSCPKGVAEVVRSAWGNHTMVRDRASDPGPLAGFERWLPVPQLSINQAQSSTAGSLAESRVEVDWCSWSTC